MIGKLMFLTMPKRSSMVGALSGGTFVEGQFRSRKSCNNIKGGSVMRSPLLTLCALVAVATFSTHVWAGDAPSVGNAPVGQQLVEPCGTVVNGSLWSVNAPIPNVNGTSQTT